MKALNPQTKRLFAAIYVDVNATPKAKEAYLKIKKQAQAMEYNIKWTPLENWHITLYFYGTTSEQNEDEIKAKLKTIAQNTKPFSLELRGVGAFPNDIAARTIWIGCSSTRELKAMREPIAPSDDFTAHLTLGRLRNTGSVRKLLEPQLRKSYDEIEVNELILFESAIYNHGSVYTIRDRFKLEG